VSAASSAMWWRISGQSGLGWIVGRERRERIFVGVGSKGCCAGRTRPCPQQGEGCFRPLADLGASCSEWRQGADFVEKQRVAGAESDARNGARAPLLSGFARLLRCRKDLGQFAEVLGGGGEEEFIICAAWPA